MDSEKNVFVFHNKQTFTIINYLVSYNI